MGGRRDRPGSGLAPHELDDQTARDLPSREAMSLVMPPEAELGMTMAEDVPSADQAPVGGRITIQPVEEEETL